MQPTQKKTLGHIIREARDHLGIDQVTLAAMLGVSPPTVSRWENDKSYPEGNNLVELSRVLKLTGEWWLEANVPELSDAAVLEERLPGYSRGRVTYDRRTL